MAAPCIYYIDGKEFTKEQFLAYVKKSNTTTVKETIDSGIKAIDTKLQTLRDALKDVNSKIDVAAKSDEPYAKPTDKDFGKRYNAQANARQVDDVRRLADRRSNIQSEYNRLTDERARIADTYPIKATPTAPFVTDTNAWTKLGLKVALKEAVKQGADKIAWTTGEQQNERYSLEKQVDEILYFPTLKEGVWDVSASKNDRQIWGEHADAKRIEAMLGKDIANKITKGEGEFLDKGNRTREDKYPIKSLRGDNLKVGGSQMLDSYGSPELRSQRDQLVIKKVGDKYEVGGKIFPHIKEAEKFKENYGLGIVGNVAKSLFKQEPKTVEISNSDTPSFYIRYTEKKAELVEKEKRIDEIYNGLNDGKFTDPRYAREYNILVDEAQDLRREIKDIERTSSSSIRNAQKPKTSSTQHSIDITPEMKAEVEGKGQPLFKDAEAQYRIESGKNIIEAIKDFNQSKNKARATVALTHEIMHPTVVSIIDGAKEGNEVGTRHTETIVNEFNKANPNSKVTVEDLIKGNDAFKDGTTSKQYRQVQEFIAKAWEKYHTEGGKGFSDAFQKVLDQITKAFQSVYKSITGKQLTPELKQMFDDILGKEQSTKVEGGDVVGEEASTGLSRGDVEKPSNWSKERLGKEIEKLDPYESQGYGVTRNQSLKESMVDFPDKARLAFELRDFFKRVYKKDFEKYFDKRPLSSLSQFFYTDAKSLKDWVDNQIEAINNNIKSNKDYIDSLSNSKSDQKSKEMWADTIEKSKNEIERLKAEYESYEKEKNGVSDIIDKKSDNVEISSKNGINDQNEEATDFGKVISASSRFRPTETVVFDKPIIGKNGNKLISYQWAYEWTMQPNYEGELKSKRVSDWTQAESSAETGRDIVHKFTVQRKDGTIVTVSSETIPSLLGYVDAAEMKNLPSVVSSVKTLAKQRMQLAILKAQEAEYNKIKKEVESGSKPNITIAAHNELPFVTRKMIDSGRLNPNDFTYFKMGDEIFRQDGSSKTPNKETIEQLTHSWVNKEIERRGGKKPSGLYDLERRIERQEKKVEQATGSKIKTEDQSLSPNKEQSTKVEEQGGGAKIEELEAKRESEVLDAGKPEIKMEFVSAKELVDSKDPIGNKKVHNDIKERYKKLKELLDCVWAKK